MIPNGVQAIEFRSRTVDTNLATTKGSIYVGTSSTSTIGGNTVYAVETINPVNNAVTGWVPNNVQLPIYNGSYGTTGMAFATAANMVVGRAEALGNASSTYSVGGSASGSGVGNAVYFNGGVPVALAKVANAVYADSAGSAGTATKLSSSKGNSTTPVYFSGGKPVACTDYANATVKYASGLKNPTRALKLVSGTSGSFTIPDTLSDGQLLLRLDIKQNDYTIIRECLIYYSLLLMSAASVEFPSLVEVPGSSVDFDFTNLITAHIAIDGPNQTLKWKISSTSGQYTLHNMELFQLW